VRSRRTIAVAIVAFQLGVLVGALAYRSLQPADSRLVQGMRELERELAMPRLEWLQ
jgi:hypothetical protein